MFTNLLFGFGLFPLLLLAESGVKRAKKWVLDGAVAAQALHADEDESLGDCSCMRMGWVQDGHDHNKLRLDNILAQVHNGGLREYPIVSGAWLLIQRHLN